MIENERKANGQHHDDDGPLLQDETINWWDACHLRTILTEPRRHELVLPNKSIVRLETADFLSVHRFTVRFLDSVGSLPQLPEKAAMKFLKEKVKLWFAERVEIAAADEGSDRGLLMADICEALRSAPETDAPQDISRGAVLSLESGEAAFSARRLLERVRRACPVKFSAGDFYSALQDLGCRNPSGIRVDAWVGRAWVAPGKLLRDAVSAETAENVGLMADDAQTD